jgi:Ca2+-binding RTX toxin-like protein
MSPFRHRAALGAAVAVLGSVAAFAPAANAAVTSTVDGAGLHISSDDQSDSITLASAGGVITINGTPTTQPAATNTAITVDAGGGDDIVDASALAVTDYGQLTVHGGDGDDTLTGGANGDTLNGDAGNDHLVGFKNPATSPDVLNGGDGDDTAVWNNGDGTDTFDGGAGTDALTVNGSPTGDDDFTIAPGAVAGHVQFNRISLNGATTGNFGIDSSTIEQLTVNGLGGNDTATGAAGLAAVLPALTLNGGDGNDTLTGGDGNDTIDGGAGDDVLTGFKGTDTLIGGDNDDTSIWNNGDGTDTFDGGDGTDVLVVNGSPTGDDNFTIAPGAVAGHVQFNRISLNGATTGNFGIDNVAIEGIEVQGLGGNDTATGANGLAALLPLGLALDGGDGNDTLTGGDTNDVLDGGAGDDVLTGGKGIDNMLGDDGNDTNVWNNGDGSDLFDGGAGTDALVVNGSPTGDDEFTIAPGTRAGHVQFNRISLNGATAGNFGIDNTTIEQVQVNGLGGNDRATGSTGLAALLPGGLRVDGGDGDDVLTGGDSNDTITGGAGDDILFGGAGNDTLTSGGGIDLLNGGDGDDTLNARDGDADVVRGGAGTDSATTDATTVDVVDGVENLDATPAVAPPVTLSAPPATVVAPTVKVEAATATSVAGPAADTKAFAPKLGALSLPGHGKTLTAKMFVSCPAAETGGCTATVTVATRHAVKVGGGKAVVVLGSTKVKLAGGHSTTVSIRLASGTARFATSGKLATTVSVVSHDAAGNVATASAARTLVLPKRR